jgi:hypothetical protein
VAEGKRINVNVTVDAAGMALELKKLDLKNGDLVVVQTARDVSHTAMSQIRDQLERLIGELLPGSTRIGLIVLSPGMSVEHLTERSLAAAGFRRDQPLGMTPEEMRRMGLEPVSQVVHADEDDEDIPNTGAEGTP